MRESSVQTLIGVRATLQPRRLNLMLYGLNPRRLNLMLYMG